MPLTSKISSIELKEDTTIVVLGASGDLAKKKTVRVDCPASSATWSGKDTDDEIVPSTLWFG